MYLKQIKATGFKSFADKIDIELTSGISGIVGPNGSGKSNVVDAVRWVLGEQSVKQLRGEGSMTDVIFTGSKSRKGSNYASVTLVFDNSDRYLPLDFDLVSIKRTVFKNGENEYYINDEKCRLKDITDMLTDTGASKESYNIISQGDIGKILSSKPEERRAIFEDAARVLKYKKRKEEALRKLQKTKDNLTRVNDIIDEISVNIEPLKIQSEQAKIYKKDKNELENVEIALIVNDVEKFNYEYKEAKEKVEVLTDKITNMLSSTSKEQALIENIKVKINDLNNDLYKKQQELVEISSNVERLQGEKNLITERSKYNSKDVKLHDNILSLKEKEKEIEKEEEVIKTELEVTKKENNEILSKINILIEKLKEVNNKKLSLDNELKLELKNLLELKHKRDVISSSIENNSLLPLGVKSVLNNPKLIGIHNIVGKVIEYDESYSSAIDIALGASSSYIICDNEGNAKEAINYLKDKKLGRATFYPLNIIKPRIIDEESYEKVKRENDFVDIASNLVKFDTKYKNIILNLLGNVIVVKNIDSANKISRIINHKYKVVTLLGDVVNIGGSITGGNYKNKNSILSEKYELENILKDITKKTNVVSELENRINENDELLSNKEEEKNSLNILYNSNNEIINNKTERLTELSYRLESTRKDINNNQNIIDGVLTKEEENLINEYYKVLENKEKKIIEIDETRKSLENVKEELTNNESLLKLNNNEYTKLNNELKQNEIKVNRLDVKLDNLLNTLTNDYQITYDRAKANFILEMKEEDARKLVNKLKNEIKSLGPINLGAIEEYERVSERYNFLNSQKDDLLKAEDMLLDIIKQMDEVMKEKFIEAFKIIQKEFKEVFKELFRGGDAELKLTDPSNVLETGIDIVALPPGKKLQHISLLSGGEKTLTAIALLFAILRTRPVPFAILDEVEAALDEVNVDTFGKFLSNFRDKTQFIVITHKKKTMEYANVLYGITMQESGVSKLVSVKLEDLKK